MMKHDGIYSFMRKFFWFWFVFQLFTGAASVQASLIDFQVEDSSVYENGGLNLSLKVINPSDESAYYVIPQIQGGGLTQYLTRVDLLGPHESYEITDQISFSPGGPGVYAFVLTLHYTDANQQPLTFVFPLLYFVDDRRPQEISAKIADSMVQGRGHVTLELANTGDADLALHASLILPKEIKCDVSKKQVFLKSKQKRFVRYAVENLSGTDGSIYRIFAILDYNTDSFHHADTAHGFLHVVPQTVQYSRLWPALIPAALAFFYGILAWIRREAEADPA